MSARTRLLLLAPAVILLAALLVMPLGWMIRLSFFMGDLGIDTIGPPTLANYAKLLGDGFYLAILGKTVGLALLVTVATIVAGYPLAHFLWRSPPRVRGLLTILVLTPLLVSIVVTSFGWLVILGNTGVINTIAAALGLTSAPMKLMYTNTAIAVGLTHILLPFMVLSILSSLERIDPLLGEAGSTLGASPSRVVRHIIFPLALPGVIGGTTIVFSLAVSAYVTPTVLGPNGPNFITTMIYHQFVTLFNWPLGAALSAVLLLIAAVIVFVYLRMMARFAASGVLARD